MKNTITSPERALEAYLNTSDPSNLESIHEVLADFPMWHLRMLTDVERLEFYETIIRETVKDKIVLDIGSGSGILSYLAIKHGAKKVYSVEMTLMFQTLYKTLMKEYIDQGSAVLIEKNALDLTTEEFSENPTVILQEIFATDGIGENVLPVFQHLKQLKLLEGSTLLPGEFDMYLEPVQCPDLEDEIKISDFAGYPLSKLMNLGGYSRDLVMRKESNFVSCGKEKILFSLDLMRPEISDSLKMNLSCEKAPTHIRAWLRVRHNNHVLDTSLTNVNSHWGNVFFRIPAWQRKTGNVEATFSTTESFLKLTSVK